MRLYDFMDSGNGYKVRLLLHQLGRTFELVEKDIDRGETRTPTFLRINPNGRIPVLEISPEQRLFESNAILFYLAEGTAFLPSDPFERAQTLQWMCFEQYSHEPNVATPRYWIKHGLMEESKRPLLEQKMDLGRAALALMDTHLTGKDFLVAERYTIADIALYAYTHVAEEGGFDLSGYSSLKGWLQRVAGQPGHVPITWRP